MSQFLYFYPGYLPDDLSSIGLGHVGKSFAKSNPGTAGPGDNAGIIFQIDGTPNSLRFDPDQQTWKQAPGQKWWVGYWNNARPHPGSLRLKDAIDGKPVELLDGNRWEVLQARRYVEGGYTNPLPRMLTLDADGKWVQGDTVKQYRQFWETANAAAPLMFQSGDDSPELIEEATKHAYQAVVMSLSLGYRLSKFEIDALELLDMRKAGDVLRVVLDFSTWYDLTKKAFSHSVTSALSG